MKTANANDLKTWKITYNPYTDLFQIYEERVFHMPDSEIASKSKGVAKLLYDKKTHSPLLIEFSNAYEHLGDIDNMSKESIIQGVIGYVRSHGR